MKKSWLFCAAAMAVTSTNAGAVVRYDFVALQTPPFGAFSETFTGTFSYTAPSFVGAPVTVIAANLASCSFIGSRGAIPCVDVSFDSSQQLMFRGQSPSLGSVELTYLFANGFFGAAGIYDSINVNPLYRARLIVTNLNVGAVPEPGTWAMMIFGFGLVGASMRLKKKIKFSII